MWLNVGDLMVNLFGWLCVGDIGVGMVNCVYVL